ncbi:hypothetical protein MIMGU_mgv1a026597mg [Erythranthe guttata]|uniref:F-box domain-containing protein n=1 Tax=Erythranthe guttata TaxID=4155 RepID=A0A022RH60_ERYGU|nr:PREDICTED: putative F-box protein At3g16210 [Erythranthe guttata]EYU39737.1 hypothetical protein MIMGU_mgv1a026597mg [Erythranthe guttata]|eukprot:XP_012834585.1 PREDICTED: putative F-box protein At3g16210 [Erythranthe guttata]
MAEGNNRNAVYIPLHVIETILFKLPAKSVLRFRAVSRSWRDMISDPAFHRTYIRGYQNSSSQPNLFFSKPSYRHSKVSLVKFEGGEFVAVRQLVNPITKTWSVSCFCDGLVLLQPPSLRNYLLWNPSTGATMEFHSPWSLSLTSTGMCYGPILDEFKVVVISRSRQPDYSVYSFRTGISEKRRKPFANTDQVSESGLYFDGAVYWLKVDYENPNIVRILYFDPRDDHLKIRKTPAGAGGDNDRPIFLTCLKGRLCVYSNDAKDETVVKIWTRNKKNTSWEVLMSIANVRHDICTLRPMFFAGDKVVIRRIIRNMTYLDTLVVLVYDARERKFEGRDETAVFGGVFVPYVDNRFFPVRNVARPKRKRKNSAQ